MNNSSEPFSRTALVCFSSILYTRTSQARPQSAGWYPITHRIKSAFRCCSISRTCLQSSSSWSWWWSWSSSSSSPPSPNKPSFQHFNPRFQHPDVPAVEIITMDPFQKPISKLNHLAVSRTLETARETWMMIKDFVVSNGAPRYLFFGDNKRR